MIATSFLAEWALRSSALILSGALVLWVLRVKDPSIRLAAWTVLLIASLAIPGLTSVLPNMPVAVQSEAVLSPEAPAVAPVHAPSLLPAPAQPTPRSIDWAGGALLAYEVVAAILLLKLSLMATASEMRSPAP